MLRNLMGPVIGYDYINGQFSDDASLLARHRVEMILGGGNTRRFHTMRTITENTVAEHSWGVASFVYIMSDGQCSATVLMACLTHDVAERYVGDVPSPTKRALNIGESLGAIEDKVLHTAGFCFELTEQEARWLKLADYFDGMLYCIRERTLGNLGMRIVWERFRKYLLELNPAGLEAEILWTLDNAWAKVNQ